MGPNNYSLKSSCLLWLLLLFSFSNLVSAQNIGSRDNGDPSPREVKPHALTKGAIQGDVNLFSGAYNTSYNLGNVAGPSGISFSLNLNYSNSVIGGHSIPHVNGIPYGNGWNLSLPTISINSAAFNKHTQGNWTSYLSGNQSIVNFDALDALSEGKLLSFSPKLSIPGVASGRLVFKEKINNDYVFVLNAFEQYIEATLKEGKEWWVNLPDGTVYVFQTAMLAYRSASNQRIYDEMYNTSNSSNCYPGAIGNLVVPKQEVLSWHVSKIYNNNFPSESIIFDYQSFGNFNYFKEFFNKHIFQRFIANHVSVSNLQVYRPNEWSKLYFNTAKELFLKSVRVVNIEAGATLEQIDLEYELDNLPGGHLMIDPNGNNVFKKDDLYYGKIERYWGINTNITSSNGSIGTVFTIPTGYVRKNFSGWKRYLHWKSDNIDPSHIYHPQMQVNNPYIANGHCYIQNAPSNNNSLPFDHAYIESERVSMHDLPCGETYEVRAFIRNDNVGPGFNGHCGFDVNIVSGISSSPYVSSFSGPTNYGADLASHRDFTIFSTFNQAVKWNSLHDLTGYNNLLVTSNYFTMPYLPGIASGFNIQIGPSNADISYTSGALDVDLMNNPNLEGIPSSYNAYHNERLGGQSRLKRFENVPHNFGIGMPWHMIHDAYDYGVSSPREHPMYRHWWNDGQQGADWDNEPTSADENVALEGMALIRYSKVPYMLKRVKHYKMNGNYDYTNDNGANLVSELHMDYEIKTATYNSNPIPNDPMSDFSYRPNVSTYNIVFLKSIRQVPVDPTDDNTGFSFDATKTPSVHFEYGLQTGSTNSYLYNLYNAGKVYALTKIVDQLGGITELEYYDLDNAVTILESKTSTGNSSIPSDVQALLRRFLKHQLAYQIEPVLKNKKYYTQNSSYPQVWEYLYVAADKRKFNYAGSYSSGISERYSINEYQSGFKKVKVIEPFADVSMTSGTPPFTWHYFKTDEGTDDPITQYCLFGKLYKTEQFDATGKIERQTDIEYGITHAYENGIKRDHNYLAYPNSKTYWDYRTHQSPSSFPSPVDIPIVLAGFDGFNSSEFVESLVAYNNSSYSDFFKNSYFVKKTKETVTEYEHFYIPPPIGYNGGLTPGNGNGPLTPVRDPLNIGVKVKLVDLNDDVCNVTLGQEKSLGKINRLGSVFKYTFPILITPRLEGEHGVESFQLITEYEYWEARMDGLTSCDGFKILKMDNTNNNVYLYYEPSWQLYKKKVHSPQQPDIINEEEYFYYYDIANDEFNDRMGTDLDGLTLSHTHGMRNVPYEVRSTFFKGQDVVRQSQYYHYDARWANSGVVNTITVESDLGECPLPPGPPPPYVDPIRACGCYDLKITNSSILPVAPEGYFLYKNPYANLWYFCADAARECLDIFEEDINGGQPILSDYPNWGTVQHFAKRNPPIEIIYDANFDLIFDPNSTNPAIEQIISAGILLVNHLDDPLATTVETGFDPNNVHPSLRLGEDNGIYYIPNIGMPMSKSLLLRATYIQVDEMVLTDYLTLDDFPGLQLTILDDAKFQITRFRPDILSTALGGSNSNMEMPLFPFANIRNKLVIDRNRFSQVQLMEDEKGLQTFFEYEEPYRIWNVNSNTSPDRCGNFVSVMLPNIGMPKCIKTGYGLANEQTTCFEFWRDKSVKKITDANGMFTEYTFDEYGRMKESFLNGERLNLNKYGYWENDNLLSFENRTKENYVESFLFTESNSNKAVQTRGYFDPLGREFVSIKRTVPDAENLTNTGSMVVSGMPVFNQWDMAVKKYKSFEVALGVNQPFELVINTDNIGYPQQFQASSYENGHRRRQLRSADFGITLGGANNVSQSYRLVKGDAVVTELGLSASEASFYFPFDPSFYRVRVETSFDQDGKQTDSYTNVFGQKIATKQYPSLSTPLITLFQYDEKGNLVKVVNPSKQETLYKYNLQGQLYEKITVDGGTTRYMYNKSGQVVFEFDAKSADEEYIRYYAYDIFGRPTIQGRTTIFGDQNNPDVFPLYYQDIPFNNGFIPFSSRQTLDWLVVRGEMIFGGPANQVAIYHEGLQVNFSQEYEDLLEQDFTYEKSFAYDFADATGLHLTDNAAHYATNFWHKLLGKPTATISYDNDGNPVLYNLMSYNAEGRLEWELQQFRKEGITATDKGLAIRIDYPTYGLQGNLLAKNVDVHADQELDFQYAYGYDDWNRLSNVYASYNGSGENGRLLARYHYNDVTGLLAKTEYYGIDKNGDRIVVDELEYDYDDRYRMKEMTSTLFDWRMYYDNNHPFEITHTNKLAASYNYNGNINATVGTYKLANTTNLTPTNFTRSSTAYGYRYDGINRLTAADAYISAMGTPTTPGTASTTQARHGDEAYAYDAVGNITGLTRYDMGGASWHYGYTYQPGTNRLAQVRRNGVADTYTYDPNGNLLTDTYRSTAVTSYGRANLPTALTVARTGVNYIGEMLYNTGDTRIFKSESNTVSGSLNLLGSTFYLKDATGSELGTMETDEVGDKQWTWYVFGKDRFAKVKPPVEMQPAAAPVATHSSSSLFGLFDYTLFENTAFYEGPEFYVHDHLGNTRVVYTPVVGTSSIAYTLSAAIDYFPYGKELRSYYNGEEERYLTTHHERDGETGLDYRGARFYDSDNGRFLSLDPRADEFASWSPYNYVFSDPIKYTDPDGKGPFLVIPLIWAAVELGFAIYDSYDLVTTLTDPNASTSDKLITAGGFAIGALGPGGGYGTAGKAGVKGVDNLVTTAGKNLPANTTVVTPKPKTYQTYTKPPLDPKDGVYSGKTSGTGTPEANLEKRDLNHHKNGTHGPAQLDKSSPNSDAIRGREQELIDLNGGAKSQGGNSGNAIQGIGDKNPKKQQYLDASKQEFQNP